VSKAFFKKSGMMDNPRSLRNILETVSSDMKNVGHAKLVVTNAQQFTGKAGLSLSSIRTPEEQAIVREILADFDTVIVDEAHHYPTATWKNFVQVFKGKKVIFLTATPFHGTTGNEVSLLNDKSLKKVYEIPISKLESK
jgi:superfamily II DNA or RNA helicase